MDLPLINNKHFAVLKSKMMPNTFKIRHILGIKNSIADALNRLPLWFSSSAEWKARTNIEIGLPEALKSETGMHLMVCFTGESCADRVMAATVDALPIFLEADCESLAEMATMGSQD